MKLVLLLMFFGAALLVAGCQSMGPRSGGKDQYIVYIGSLGAAPSSIQAFRLDAAKGEMLPLGMAAETTRPAFLELHPGGKLLYSVGELKDGVVRAFAIDKASGKLKMINESSTKGNGPCHVSVDRAGKNVLAANYGSGSFAVFPIREGGALAEASDFVQDSGSSVNPKRQEGPHGHSINVSPDGRFALAADLGLDKIFVYRYDAERGKLTPNDPPFAAAKPGAGPRHIAFHPGGKFVYAINEMHCTITTYAWDAEAGRLTELQTITTLPADFKGENTCSEVRVHPSGKFVYGANRGHDSIAIFAVDGKTGTLKARGWAPAGGNTPRNFNIDPTGRWLIVANQASNNLAMFEINGRTGALRDTGKSLAVTAPSCVRFLEAGE